MNFCKALATASILGVGVIASVDRASATDYKHVVMADDPAVYYEFNEPVGAIQVIDTTGKLNTDGSSRNSQYVGQRTVERSDDPNFALNPGMNVIFGGVGPLGTVVEFNDPSPAFSSTDLTLSAGGYIETGLHKNFGPKGGDFTIEFLFRDDEILVGLNRQEYLVSQARPDHPDTQANLPAGQQRYIVGTGVIDNDPYEDVVNPAGGFYDFGDFRGTTNIAFAQNRSDGSRIPGELVNGFGDGDFDQSPPVNKSGFVPPQGKWLHYVETFESGGSLPTSEGGSGSPAGQGRGVLRLYIDGQFVSANEIKGVDFSLIDPARDLVANPYTNPELIELYGTNYWNSDAPLILGASGGESNFHPSFYYDGFLDEFAVYDFRLDDPDGNGDESDSRVGVHADAFAAAKASFSSADFDYDNDVDGTDFLAWQRAVGPDDFFIGAAPADLVHFQGSAGGDANGDDLSDGADLAIWGNQFGTTTALATSTSVPEPSTGLLLGGLLALTAMGRRRVGASR